MKKLYLRKLGLVMLMVGLGFSQVRALTGYASITVKSNNSTTVEDDVKVSGALTVGNNGSLTIMGDLEVGGQISVGSGAYLIVYGNFTSTTTHDIQIDGNIVVVSNLNIANGADIKNDGNLIVGGDFVQAGGDIDTKGNDGLKIYILNPDANIDVPEGSFVANPDNFGSVEEFIADEGGGVSEIVNDLIISALPVIGYQWRTTGVTSSWSTGTNWSGNTAPD